MSTDREKALDMALAQIDKQFGKGSIMRMGDKTTMGIESVSTGALSLDLALGIGGLPRGRVTEIYGPESSGKSTLAMHVVAEAQRNGGVCAYIDAEHAMDPVYARAIGVDIDQLLISQPDTGEQALEITDMLVRSGAIDVVVIDSVAALTPKAEIEGEMGDHHVGLQARLMSQALRKLTGNLSKTKTIAIFINQLREKIGVLFGSPETTPGGRALKFYSSVRLDIRRIESLKDGAEVVGNRTRVKVVKNKCVAAGTKVFDPTTGLTHLIEEIVGGAGGSVVAADKAGMLHIRSIVQRFDQGEAEVIALGLRDGTSLRVTPDHRIMTDRGWREAGELAVGDRVARPRRFAGFSDAEPYTADESRLLGLAATERLPAEFFAPDLSADVAANLIFGLLESDGYVTREQTGGLRVGFTTTSEQLAEQIHWLLLRWGIGSSVRPYDPTQRRPSVIAGHVVRAKLPVWEVRVSGIDNVELFTEVIPMWGPRGQALVADLAKPELRRHRGSQRNYLPSCQIEPVLSYLHGRGLTAITAASIVGAGDPKGGLRQVLGHSRLRRDRVQRLADALDSVFLRSVLDEDVWYDRVTSIGAPEWADVFDIEVDEHHTFVANDIVVSNCASPFRQAEFDIMYGKGISREGSLIDMSVDLGIVKKSGAWFTYEGEQLGQGRENAKTFLIENPEVMMEISDKVLTAAGLKPAEGEEPVASIDSIDEPIGFSPADEEPIQID